MPTESELRDAFAKMQKDRVWLFRAAELELSKKEALKIAEAAIINGTDAKELGTNEQARNARIRELTALERQALDQAEAGRRNAQLAYELMAMEVDCIKWQIRAASLGAE